jgi:hypothetical protein
MIKWPLTALLAIGLSFGDLQSAGAQAVGVRPSKPSTYAPTRPFTDVIILHEGVKTELQWRAEQGGLQQLQTNRQREEKKRCGYLENSLDALGCRKF